MSEPPPVDRQALGEACDPTTPAGRLRELAGRRDPALRRAVAGNPAVPLDLLLDLMTVYPAEAAHNPALPLLLLERPDALVEQPPSLGALLSIEPPPWLLAVMQGHWSDELRPRGPFEGSLLQVRFGEWLARRADTPAKLLARLCTSHWARTRALAASHRRAPARVLALLHAVGGGPPGDQPPGDRPPGDRPPGDRPPVTTDQLRRAARLGSWGAELVAAHPETPDELLATLADHRSAHVLETLARRPRLPAAIGERLAAGPHPPVWHALAANPSTPVALLVGYASASSLSLRRAAARNPSLPLEQLRRLTAGPPDPA